MKIAKWFCIMTLSLACMSATIYAADAEDIGFGGGGDIKFGGGGLQDRGRDQYDNSLNVSASVPVYDARRGSSLIKYSVNAAMNSQEERLSLLPNTLQLYDAHVSAGALITNSNSKEMYMLRLGVSIAEEKETLSAPQERLSFLGMGTYHHRPNLSYIYGLGYSYIFGRGRLFPAFGLNWKIDEKRDLIFILPLLVRYVYKVSPVLKTSLYSALFGDQYRLKNDGQYPGQPDMLYLHAVGFKLGAGAEYKVASGWTLGADIGSVIRRDADVSTTADSSSNELAQDRMTGDFFFQAFCKWSFGKRTQSRQQ